MRSVTVPKDTSIFRVPGRIVAGFITLERGSQPRFHPRLDRDYSPDANEVLIFRELPNGLFVLYRITSTIEPNDLNVLCCDEIAAVKLAFALELSGLASDSIATIKGSLSYLEDSLPPSWPDEIASAFEPPDREPFQVPPKAYRLLSDFLLADVALGPLFKITQGIARRTKRHLERSRRSRNSAAVDRTILLNPTNLTLQEIAAAIPSENWRPIKIFQCLSHRFHPKGRDCDFKRENLTTLKLNFPKGIRSRKEEQNRHAGSGPPDFVASPIQEQILKLLEDRGPLRGQQIADEVLNGEPRSLYRHKGKAPGHLAELEEVGLVSKHRKIGYYLTRKPPGAILGLK